MDENQLCSKYARSNNNKSRWSGQRIFADELSHQCECLPYIWRPWSLWKALSSLTKYNYSLYCASGTSRALFWQAWHLTAGALQSSRGLLLPFPRRCSHTSPTAGVLVSIPSLAELTSPCRTPPLQFTWSRLISTSLSSRLQFRDQRPAEKGTLSSDRSPCNHGRCVCAAVLEISPRKGHLDSGRRVNEVRAVQRDMLVWQSQRCAHSYKNHTPWLRQQNAYSPGMSRTSGHGDCCCWHSLISLNDAVKEWRGRRGAGIFTHLTTHGLCPVKRNAD